MASVHSFLAVLARRGRSAAFSRWAIALVLGLVAAAGMPPVSLWPVFLVSLTGLVLALDAVWSGHAEARGHIRLRAAAAVGWWFGFGYFLAGLYWLGFAFLVEAEKFAWLLPLAVIALPAGLAVFFAIAAATAMIFWSAGLVRVLALAVALGVTEWLRGNVLTGLPWNALGYALAGNDWLMQSASLFGVTGLSFLAVLVFAMPASAFRLDGRIGGGTMLARPLIASGAILLAMLAFGVWRLSGPQPPAQGSARLRLVQPNIPQAEKWEGANRQRIFDTFLDLSRRDPSGATAGFGGITHVVWPESSLPFLMLQTPAALEAIGRMLPDNVVLVTGSLRAETAADGTLVQVDGLYTIYNDIAVLDGTGRPIAIYDKRHLVPFGEYLPAQRTLEAIGLEQLTRLKGGFTPGSGPRKLEIPGLPPVVPLICYEAIFPEEMAPSPDQTWLLNLTNDAWFGVSAGPYQHLQQARLRAVEQGRPVIRVANTGISVVVGATGEILAHLPLETRGVLETALPGRLPPSLYALAGDGVLAALLLAGGLGVTWLRRRPR
jgi:apolipoprotein N-acyltransferase